MARPPAVDEAERLQKLITRTNISPDLLAAMAADRPWRAGARAKGSARRSQAGAPKSKPASDPLPVIIEFNDRYPAGSGSARAIVIDAHAAATAQAATPERRRRPALGVAPDFSVTAVAALFDEKVDTLSVQNSLLTRNYLFGYLTTATIEALASFKDAAGNPLVYKIWFDHPIERCVYDSVSTIKCDAARTTFTAAGKGLVWAVADTGVDGAHPHFATNETLDVGPGLAHRDFTREHVDEKGSIAAALTDADGHGTHVAGIIAGQSKSGDKVAIHRKLQTGAGPTPEVETRDNPIFGLAPFCKILSLKVLENQKAGSLSVLLAALGHLQIVNDYGRDLRVHGLNLSLGYPFDPEWFAAGQSPLCIEVDRLVQCGVVVVVAAGNGGYDAVSSYYSGSQYAASSGTIGDPGFMAVHCIHGDACCSHSQGGRR